MHTLNITLRRKRIIKSQARDVHELTPKLEAVLSQYQGCQAVPVSAAVITLYSNKIEDKFDIKTSKGLLKVHLYDAEKLV